MSREEIKEVLRKLQEKKNSELWIIVNGILFQIKDDSCVNVDHNTKNDFYHVFIIKGCNCISYIAEYDINDISFEVVE